MSNEDKRQYTVIAEAISLIEDYTGVYVTDEGCSFQYMTPEGVKYMLESLLPKERENLMSAYIDGTGYVINGGVPKKAWFRNKYKPYDK